MDSTSWTLIEGAAAGGAEDRETFVRRYGPAVRGYLASRWAGSRLLSYLQDAEQDVFFECFRQDGALESVERRRRYGFRAFLFGVVRNVARMNEARFQSHGGAPLEVTADNVAGNEDSPSRAYDHAWARSILQETAELQEQQARAAGNEALRRVALLKLRFQEGLSIREISARWQIDPVRVHHDYARARTEFKQALATVLRSQNPDRPHAMQEDWEDLAELLVT